MQPKSVTARAVVLAALFCVGCDGCTSEEEEAAARIDAAIDRGLELLAAHADDDGAFPSATYGAFRDGRATTPLVLMAMWIRADDPHFEAQYRRGVDWIAEQPTEVHAYPVYTLATSLLVLGMPRNERHRARVAELRTALAAEQREDGGFGYLSEDSNLSTTLFAIGALRLAGTERDDPIVERARAFVERCQNFGEGPLDDGGFFFSPGFTDGNKAGPARTEDGTTRFHSYGSMTADGLRALLRTGAARDSPRVLAASRWLRTSFVPDHNPGTFEPLFEPRRDGSYFYYAWSVAHAFTAVGETAWAEPLSRELMARQESDGAWRNRFTEMHEDDPLVATSFAVASLALAREAMTGGARSHAADR
jgi:hypothetical protein